MIDLQDVPRYLFFTGKGGVGKTSLSCATGLALAERGKQVLIVSTDPASNLDEVLETPLAGTPTTVASAAPESKPYRTMATATASSKKFDAPIIVAGPATSCWT